MQLNLIRCLDNVVDVVFHSSMISKMMPRGDEVTINIGPRDAAFIFRRGTGLEVYRPTNLTGTQATDEDVAAMMLGWIIMNPVIRDEMFERFKTAVEPKKGKSS